MRCGPGSCERRARARPRARRRSRRGSPSTPMPRASETKSSGGRERSNRSAALPSVRAPTRDSSRFRIAYAPVVEDDRRDVEVLARLRPQRLQRVHRAAVGLQVQHLAIGARDRGAGRDGHALADRAAGERQPVVARARPRSRRRRTSPPVFASSLTIAPSGSSAPIALRDRLRVQRAARTIGPARRRAARAPSAGAPSASASASSAASASDAVGDELVDLAAFRRQHARQVRVREERDRLLGVDEHEVAQALQLRDRELGEVAEPVDRGQARAAFEPRRERLAQELGAGRLRDPRRREQPAFAQRLPAEQQRRRFAAAQRLGRQLDLVGGLGARAGRDGSGSGLGAVDHDASAGRISVATPPRRASLIASATSAPTVSGPFDSRTHRDTLLRDADDVGLQRRVERLVIRRVVADDVDDRRARPARVVQVREAVAETGTEVQQRGRGLAGHAPVAVGRAGRRRLRTTRGSARISGTSSSAATKCISDVPGFVKHVSTPFATSVRSTACAPFMTSVSSSVEQRSGIQDAVRDRTRP